MRRTDYPKLCSIAGYDPTGRAGVSADRRVFEHAGVPGTSVLTAITLQDDDGVHAITSVSPDQLREQLRAVTARYTIGAWKTGMLSTGELTEVVAEHFATLEVPRVVDPVLRGSAGGALLDPAALDVFRSALIPVATVLTPNAVEAAVLLGLATEPRPDESTALAMAAELVALGCAAAVVTGVDVPPAHIRDCLAVRGVPNAPQLPVRERIPNVDPRGTGCVFASCVAVALAGGASVEQAVARAGTIVHAAIARAARSDDPRRLRLEGCPLPTHPW